MMADIPVTVVVPTIREASINRFFSEWGDEFKDARVILVEDNPEPSFKPPTYVEHYSWRDIDGELGDASWIIPRRTDCVRSYGYLKAAEQPTRFVLTLDDDCYPEAGFEPGEFLASVTEAMDSDWPDDRWWNTIGDSGLFPRGYPYEVRHGRVPTGVHHGLWSNVPDLDAPTQMHHPEFRLAPAHELEKVPSGVFFPMCGMNLAFRPEVIPAMYFLLMGRDHPYDRFGDIWSGIFVKRIADHLNVAITSGRPSVHHARASNVWANLKKETPGLEVNEELWKSVARVRFTGDTFAACYRELAEQLDMPGEYWDRLREAMQVWVGLVTEALEKAQKAERPTETGARARA